jgi:hypothetical protein
MDYDNNDKFSPLEDEHSPSKGESGSDDLLAADNLHLPADANILVRLHAMRAWLRRRVRESELEVGRAALDLQDIARATESLVNSQRLARTRRRAAEDSLTQRAQRKLSAAQRHLSAYEEARELLEDCVAHTTVGDRLLVEYYLNLEERMQAFDSPTDTPWIEAMQDVLQRISQVGTPEED